MKWLYALGIVVASFFISLSAMNYLSPPCPQGRTVALAKPFQKRDGASYFAAEPVLVGISDSSETPSRSNALVCENNRPLGPAHVAHAEIASKGGGRFSHWGPGFVFSASDSSDPNVNGRSYWAVQPQ
jgi:hypothetical protein